MRNRRRRSIRLTEMLPRAGERLKSGVKPPHSKENRPAIGRHPSSLLAACGNRQAKITAPEIKKAGEESPAVEAQLSTPFTINKLMRRRQANNSERCSHWLACHRRLVRPDTNLIVPLPRIALQRRLPRYGSLRGRVRMRWASVRELRFGRPGVIARGSRRQERWLHPQSTRPMQLRRPPRK